MLGLPRSCTHYVQGFVDLHVNSIAICVWWLPMCRSAQNDGCAAQTNPTPDLTPTLTLTLLGGRGLFSRSAGAVLSLRASLKTLHVRAIKHLVPYTEYTRKIIMLAN